MCSSDLTASLGCCPLPARDILAKGDAVLRGAQCGPDEVATGANGNSLMCSKINTAKYRLGPAQTSCYVGSGVSGSSGSANCGLPSATLQAMSSAFGSDGCIGSPFGSLIVARTGKNCGDVQAAQLFFSQNNQPVPMFLP